MIVKTFRYCLYPSRAQLGLLERMLEACRRWCNTCLEERKTAWETKQRSVGEVDPSRTSRTYCSCGAVFAELYLAERWIHYPVVYRSVGV